MKGIIISRQEYRKENNLKIQKEFEKTRSRTVLTCDIFNIHLVHTISSDNLITDEAEIPKQLMIMSLAISETFLLVMTMT